MPNWKNDATVAVSSSDKLREFARKTQGTSRYLKGVVAYIDYDKDIIVIISGTATVFFEYVRCPFQYSLSEGSELVINLDTLVFVNINPFAKSLKLCCVRKSSTLEDLFVTKRDEFVTNNVVAAEFVSYSPRNKTLHCRLTGRFSQGHLKTLPYCFSVDNFNRSLKKGDNFTIADYTGYIIKL